MGNRLTNGVPGDRSETIQAMPMAGNLGLTNTLSVTRSMDIGKHGLAGDNASDPITRG